MGELIALALPGGQPFVDALQRAWDDGDAVFPLDGRLPAAEAKRVMDTIRPTAVIEADGERRTLDGGLPVDDGDAVVVATSGTTGHPKGVIHTHDSVAASAHATSSALDVDPDTDVWLACLPLAHIGGLAVVMRSLVTGTGLIVHDGFDAEAVDRAAASGATLASLVTRTLTQIDTEAFRTILIGGAAPPPDRPHNVIATYGMTETGSGCVYERGPLDGVEIRVDDGDQIWLRGSMLARAYRTHDGEQTSERLLADADGWFATGDLGHWGDDGLIRVDGRAGDVIVSGGEKVWPSRVEPLLAAQPGVAEVALVGRPHPEWGHEVVAVVVAEAGAEPEIDQLRDAVKAQLPAWYAPRRIEYRSALPKTALGKVRRLEL